MAKIFSEPETIPDVAKHLRIAIERFPFDPQPRNFAEGLIRLYPKGVKDGH